MAQIIMIEGIDRVGKTTLANMLRKDYGFKVFKDKSFYQNIDMYASVEKVITFLEMVKQMDLTVICDRSYLSEVVYSVADRHHSPIQAHMYFDIITNYIRNLMNDGNLSVLLIYVKPSNINLSGKLHGCLQSKHNELYDAYYDIIGFDKKVCQWETLGTTVKEIKEWSDKHA